jgi:hypothetical protein
MNTEDDRRKTKQNGKKEEIYKNHRIVRQEGADSKRYGERAIFHVERCTTRLGDFPPCAKTGPAS